MRECVPGLGDFVSAALDSVGITKRRAQNVADWIGVKNCGCHERQEALNEIGDKMLAILRPPTPSGPAS